MREDWEVRKWGEVLSIINGKNQKGVENNNGIYPIYGSGGIMGYADDFLCPDNTVIIGRKGNINKPIFVKEKFWNVDTAFGLVSNENILNSKYLFYFCVSYNFEKLNKAVTIPSLTKSDLLNIKINLPPLQTQHRIVKELDCLTSIIEKQKKQLEELDNLAQAIFYDMFGDPIENEKGWKNDILINLCTKITDGTHDTPLKLTEGIKFITGKHIRKGCIDYDHSDYVDIQTHVEIFKRCNPEYGDILYTNIGANLGTAAINKVHYEFSMKNVSLLKINKNLLSSYFLEFILNNDRKKLQIIRDFSKGGAQKFLSLNSISNIKIPLPPLPLQQQFASKIEAIEKQKELIKKSIKETEDLFNSRMDYYFN